jgi:enoyl-CoA hydratase
VPRDELDEATLALAEEIARNEPFVIQATKRAVNRAWDVAGFRQAMDANVEIDTMIEAANLPDRQEFRRITQEQGLKAAIAWRDERFRAAHAGDDPEAATSGH